MAVLRMDRSGRPERSMRKSSRLQGRRLVIKIMTKDGHRVLLARFRRKTVSCRILSVEEMKALHDDDLNLYYKKAKAVFGVICYHPNIDDGKVIRAIDYLKANVRDQWRLRFAVEPGTEEV